jgi:glycosyltransferase involved in cell wall biosynthesis
VIVFTGDMSYWPNADAVAWFAREVLPRLLAREPRPLFAIVGAKPTDIVQRLAGPDILVTGRVEDVRPYVAHAAVMVAPLLLARGIQNKVLEGMAMGKIVVATAAAERGLHVRQDGAVLVAENAAEMAALVGEALDGRHDEVGPVARRVAVGKFSWNAQLGRLDAMMTDNTLPEVGAA